MSLVGLTMTLVAAAGWSGLDITRKILVGRMEPVPVLVWLVAGQLVLFTGWAVYDGPWFLGWRPYLWLAAASVALNVAANLLFLHAVRVSPISVMVPLLSFVPVFTVAAANPLLGELPTSRQLVGIAAVVVGALALGAGDSVEGERRRGPIALCRALLREPGSLPMLGTSLFWAMAIVVDKLAIEHASIAAHGVVLNAGIGVLLLVWMVARGELSKLEQVRGSWGLLGVAVIAGSAGLGGQLLAVQILFAGVVEAIKRAVGIVVSVVVGRLSFAEPVTRGKLIAIILMTIGTALIVV